MKKRQILLLLTACTVLAATGCSGSKEEVPKTPLTIVQEVESDEIIDRSGEAVVVTAIQNPVDYSYSNASTEMIFKKKDGKWIDALESDIPLEQEKFQMMANNFLNLKSLSVMDGGDMEELGLNNPQYSVDITDEAGNSYSILMGNQDEGGNFYSTVDGENFFIVSQASVDTMIFDYERLVAKDTLDINVTAEDIASASVTVGGKTTKIKKSDKDAMARVAEGMSSLKPVLFSSFHASAAELSAAGLDEANRTTFTAVFMNTEAEEKQSVTVYVGEFVDPNQEYRYIQLDGSQMISYIETPIVNALLNQSEEPEA